MKIGYARVSTQDQDTALQLDALTAAGCTTIYEEKASGASTSGRPVLASCLASLKEGDTLTVYKLDRIARSLFGLLDILRQLRERNASIKSLTEPIDTSTSMGLFMVQVLGAVAQLERSMIIERSIAGQRAAMARGVHCGRPRALSAELEAALVLEYLQGGTTYEAVGTKYGVSASAAKRAVYRVVKSPEYIARNNV